MTKEHLSTSLDELKKLSEENEELKKELYTYRGKGSFYYTHADGKRLANDNESLRAQVSEANEGVKALNKQLAKANETIKSLTSYVAHLHCK